jgi:hypothetical protein
MRVIINIQYKSTRETSLVGRPMKAKWWKQLLKDVGIMMLAEEDSRGERIGVDVLARPSIRKYKTVIES